MEVQMRSVSVAEAKAKLSEVLEAAASGEDIIVTRHGKPYVRLAAVASPQAKAQQQKIDWDRLRSLRASLPELQVSSVDLIRQMRDEGF
jgi:prevent-host-death family protein